MFRSDSKSDERNPRRDPEKWAPVFGKDHAQISRDPEKWAPVFGKDHARTKSWSGMMPPLKIIPLYRPRSAGVISKPSVAENVAPHSGERSPVGLSAVLTPPGSAPRSPVIT